MAAPLRILFMLVIVILDLGQVSNSARTTEIEIEALKAIGSKWQITPSPTWNTSGDPCTGPAIDDSETGNPGIKCLCSFDNGNTCHITELRVSDLDKSGEIPQEFANLIYLTDLNLKHNYLSGVLPAFLGNMTNMQYFTVGINMLTGPIPREIGNLKSLISLSVAGNRLNGTIPEELGNLTNLEQLYIHSSGVSGQIPSSFRNLKSLQILWAAATPLAGRIPDFIESWKELQDLRIEGTAITGPVPAGFSNLTALTNLRLSDIASGITSLDFLRNLKALTQLILRNNKISGEIPTHIGSLTKLKYLDLSYNSFTGSIPESFKHMTALEFLFLGNNNLSNGIPSELTSSLKVIDLSYNQFSGTLPTWLDNVDVQGNLIGNYFDISEKDSRDKWRGLRCLQQTFPCNKHNPLYSSIAVNCGGLQKTSADQIIYQRDNETLGPASFYVTENQNWGVSSIGHFVDSSVNNYVATSQSQVSNSLNSELYQTARLSPSSLRYYGLGLENGKYSVILHFAEIQILDTPSWKSLGRRYFDIYVQGRKVITDFNIKAMAGASNTEVIETFRVNVTDNFLEIQFLWVGKGTCCIPNPGTYGPLVSAIRIKPEFNPTVGLKPSHSKGKNRVLGLTIGIIFGGLAVMVLIFAIYCRKRNAKSLRALKDSKKRSFQNIDKRIERFTFEDLRNATNNFHENNKLGQGAYGVVYKGLLRENNWIAVKKLSAESKQGDQQFMNEVSAISSVQHRNLVRLYGCCIDTDDRLLVYEYLENNSLEQALFGKKLYRIHLDWPSRYNICVGIARGLAYLHEESHARIIHRDVKASNVLLDDSLNPKLSDFGLAKFFDDKKTHVSSRVAGTVGYLAPEYAMRGHLTEKADVYSFGVLLLEIVSGRRNEDSSLPEEQSYLLGWAWYLHEQGRRIELMDEDLQPTFCKDQVLRVISAAHLCTQALASQRPSMSRVVGMLTNETELVPEASRPAYIANFHAISSDSGGENTSLYSSQTTDSIQQLTPSIVESTIGEGR